MKYLLINRHAKSGWSNMNVSDHNRTLSEEGFKEAESMGKRLYDKEVSFDLMISSSAIRALTTCQLIAVEIKYPIEDVLINNEIYGSNVESIKNIISETNSDKVESLAIYGHNPTLHALAEELLKKTIDKFPTCAMLYVRFETDKWVNCFNSKNEVLFFDFPKNKI